MTYDLLIIGGGPGGLGAAVRASQLGLKVGLFEKDRIGGTCLNRGCIPTKTLMHSAGLYSEISRAAQMGIVAGPASVDFPTLLQRKNSVSDTLRAGMESLLTANKVDIIHKAAVVTAPGRVMADGEEYEAKNILIATGSAPARPPIPGLEYAMSSDDILRDFPELSSLVIIGGGVIGVEIGSLYASLGCQVTIIEALDRIVSGLDREISQNLSMIMKKRGIAVHTGASVTGIESSVPVVADAHIGHDSRQTICVRFTDKAGEKSVSAQAVLCATGRSANTSGLFNGCEAETLRGCLSADDDFGTSIPGVYAIGDVIGGIQLAHKAEYEGIAAAEKIAGITPEINWRVVPSCVYTNPEIASVGMTADEAKAQGTEVKTGKYVMGGNAKTLIEGSERGFIKLVAEAESGRLLGAHLMCERATDMVGEFVTAIVNGLTISQLALSMRPHPSFSEGISEALGAVEGKAIHVMPKGR